MEYHLTSLAMNSRCKVLEKIYFYLLKNLAVVRLPLCDNVSTKDFVGKILNFKHVIRLNYHLRLSLTYGVLFD